MNIDFLFPGRAIGQLLSPKRVHTGISGAEEACINMSRHLADLDHAVTVCADCRDAAGIYGVVVWRDLVQRAERASACSPRHCGHVRAGDSRSCPRCGRQTHLYCGFTSIRRSFSSAAQR